MICAQCKTENPDGLKFCNECGAAFKASCASCGFENAPAAKFCGNCGLALGTLTAALVKGPDHPAIRLAEPADVVMLEGERKMVTALFADIKGSMELMEDLDPEEARAIIDPALKLMMDAVRRYDGFVVQSTGDGIFALFGAPVAHEDHPQRALYSALRMHAAMRHYGERLRAEKGLNLQLRIGVNLGEVVVRTIQTGTEHTEYSPIGHSTSLAARLQTLATPGSTVIGGNMRALVEGYFQLKSLGPTRIKGVSEPVELFEVIGLGPLRTRLQRSAGRGLTKFVGRQREIEALRHAAGMAREGHGQIVAVIAEAGVGKSRLFYEFKARSQSGWMVLEALSVSHGKASPYLPVIELLHGYFGIDPKDDSRKRREKVNGRIVTLDPALEDTRPYLFALLGLVEGDDPLAQMDVAVKKRRTIDVIKRILLRESLNQPLIVIFEDLHWIDEQTQELLNLLAEAIGTARILLLVNYRPEYHHLWGNKTYYMQLTLEPLGLESAHEMLDALLTSPTPATLHAGANRERSGNDIHVGEQDGLAALKSLIINRTEGNPFFIEEIVQGLFEQGLLVRNGDIKLTRPLSGARIPATVQAMLSARIDRLAPEDKALLQTLAVIGKEFTLSQVRAVLAGSDSELDQRLAALQSAEFIYEQPTAGDIEYTFKHALTQEVAYNSILSERRKALHERAGQALEMLFASQLADHLDGLARHYARSNNLEKAAKYLRLAGLQAASRSAFSQAIRHLKDGLELLRKLPANNHTLCEELATHIGLTTTLLDYQGPGFLAEMEKSALRARAIASQVGDYDALLQTMQVLRLYYRFRHENEKSRLQAEEALATAQAHRPEAAGTAHFALGETLLFLGEFEQALHHFRQAQSSANPVLVILGGEGRPLILAESALVLWILGYPAQATELSRQAVPLARSNDHVHMILVVLWFSGLLHQWSGDTTTTMKEAQELLGLSASRGSTTFSASATGLRGWVLAKEGRVQDGLLEMRRALAAQAEAGWRSPTFTWGSLAEIHGMAGEASVGLELIEKALEQVSRTGERVWEAELHRIKGELLLTGNWGKSHEAEQCFRKAVEIAKVQHAKSWQLRATTSLARLLANQGRREEARTMLADVFNWFTEGFDTAELKDAKALLDDLSA